MKFPHYPVLFCLQVFTKGVPSALNTPSCCSLSHALGLFWLLLWVPPRSQVLACGADTACMAGWDGLFWLSLLSASPQGRVKGGHLAETDPERVVCWSFQYSTGTEIQSPQPAGRGSQALFISCKEPGLLEAGEQEERRGDRGRPGPHVVLGERSSGAPVCTEGDQFPWG